MTAKPDGAGAGDFDLSGKVAIITGSSRGIGRATAFAMAAHGASVVVSSRDQAACDTVANEIEGRFGAGRAFALAANIGQKTDLQRVVDATLDRFGRLDVLVCNAASNPHFGPLSAITDAQFQKIIENNVLSSHWLIGMAAPALVAHGDGAVIIVSSIGGLTGSATIGAYNISKAADFQLARNLAVELGPKGLRVNCIAPGLVRTDFARPLLEDSSALRALTERTPLGRYAEPSEIAGVAVFLASRAASFITGQVIVVDGGTTIASGT